jgi:hypothetical protein
VIPFLVPNALKIIAAFICAQPIRVALGRASHRVRSFQPEEAPEKRL